MTALTFTPRSPEAAWPPFMDWLRGLGLDPHDVARVEVDEDSMAAVATVIDKRDGKHYLVDGELATKQRTFVLSALPPRRETP